MTRKALFIMFYVTLNRQNGIKNSQLCTRSHESRVHSPRKRCNSSSRDQLTDDLVWLMMVMGRESGWSDFICAPQHLTGQEGGRSPNTHTQDILIKGA